MRIAALYDIHGNLEALEAVLAEVYRARVDRLVIGGDVVPGPLAKQCLRRLRECNLPSDWIRGNGELEVLNVAAGKSVDLPEPVLRDLLWTARDLDEQDLIWMSQWPRTLELESAPGLRLHFCHATPRDEYEVFTRRTAPSQLQTLFDGVEAEVVVCGHTHMQFDLALSDGVGKRRVVNAGSVGLPFGSPGAHWLMIDGRDLELRHTNFDRWAVAERLRSLDYPGAGGFAELVATPTSEEDILAVFEEAAGGLAPEPPELPAEAAAGPISELR